MHLKRTIKAVPLLVVALVSGCKMTDLSKMMNMEDTHVIGKMAVYTADYKVNASVSDEAIRDAVILSLSQPEHEYQRRFHSKTSSNNSANPGTTTAYDVKGWNARNSRYGGIELVYEDGENLVDSRELHNSYHLMGYAKKAYINVKIEESNGLKLVKISNQDSYSSYQDDSIFMTIKRQPAPIPEAEFVSEVEKRIKNIHMRFPTAKPYSGTITLKNDDVTAYANIQRNFANSFLSTNDKTDSEKSGTFKITDLQKVNFQLYPYKRASKVKYSFNYKYYYDEQGGSDFDSNYPSKVKKMIASEFNK